MSIERKILSKKILIPLLVSVIVVSCIVTTLVILIQPIQPIQPLKLAKMNISDASYLFIAPGSANRLFKVTDEGYILEVTYEDENNETMTTMNEPSAIYNLNDIYVIIVFDDSDGYLVRKNDGAVFSLKNAGIPYEQINYYKNGKTIFMDSNSNIYYLTMLQESGYSGAVNCELIKLNTENMGSITKTTYSPSEEHVIGFIVDNNGNAAYYGRQKTEISGSRSIFRIKLGNGGLYNLPQHTDNFWLGLNGTIYFLNDQFSNKIQKVSIDSSYNVKLIDYGRGYDFYNYATFTSYILTLKDRIITVDTSNNKIYEVYNPTNTPREIILGSSPISTIKCAVASDNFYYLSGNDASDNPVLIKVNATDDTYTSLYTAGIYDIYTMAVSTSDKLLFNALRMSDGVKVIGEIDASVDPAILTILDEVSNTVMVVLERIA